MWCACTHHGQGVQNCDSLQPIAVFAVFNERVSAPYVVMSLHLVVYEIVRKSRYTMIEEIIRPLRRAVSRANMGIRIDHPNCAG